MAASTVLAAVLLLAGCSLADEPIPVGPVETGPLPGELPTAEMPPAAEATPGIGVDQPVPEPEAGVVRGEIILATPGMQLPAGLEIRLSGVVFDASGQMSEFLARTTAPAPDGTFRFEDVPFTQENAAYVVDVLYNGVTFSNGQMIDPAVPFMDLPLTLYETTTDPGVVTVDAMHVVLGQHPGALIVIQVYVFSNHSDRVYVSGEPVSGGRRGSVAISLPPDAYGIAFDDGQIGGRFIPVGDLIYDTQQLLPGDRSHSIAVSYFLPADSYREVSIPILYQTDRVMVLAQEGQRIRSTRLSDAGVQVIENTAYNRYIGTGLSAGDTLTFRVSTGTAANNLLPIILGALAGVLLTGSGVYWVMRRRLTGPRPVTGRLTPHQEVLVREIARLDEAFAAGRINRFEYEARRADLKATLADDLEGEA